MPWVESPYRLWSLYDVFEVKIGELVAGLNGLVGMLHTGTVMASHGSAEFDLEDDTLRMLTDDLEAVRDFAFQVGARASVGRCDHLKKELERVRTFDADRVMRACLAISEDLVYECKGMKLLMIRPESEKYYESGPSATFGQDVLTAFPSQAFADDLGEASKCYAMNRGTACVFHLMRAMETGVRAWAAKLLIPPTVLNPSGTNLRDQMWGDLEREISKVVELMPTTTPSEKESKAAQKSVLVSLAHVRDVWRNTTMHPQEKYTPEEAEEVLNATRAFLRSLAKVV